RLYRYAPVQGERALVEAAIYKVKRRSGVVLDRALLQIMPGGTSGLSIVMQTLLDPGDEVLLPAPFWPLVRGMIAARGAVPLEVPFFTALDERSFDPEAVLEAAVTKRTTAVYVNSPHNPTGRVLPSDVVDAIARVAERHDLWVIADEAYEDLWFESAAP